MGHVHPPRALLYRLPNVSTHWGAIRARLGLYRLPNVSTHWGAIRARLGPERWLEAAAHVVHRACSAERAELVAAPRRVRVCVCMCVHLVPLCVVVLAAPGACMSLRVRYDIRVDLIPCTCVVFIGGRSVVTMWCSACARVRQSSLSCRAHWSRAGGPFHIDIRISQPHTHGATAAHTHTPPARRRPGARSGPGSGTVAHPHAETSSTQKRSQRDTHILIRLAPSAPRGAGRARAHFRSRGKHAVRRAGTAVWGRAAALRINGLKRCDRESPVSPNVNIQVKSSLTGLLFP